jgi:hypothetical protein
MNDINDHFDELWEDGDVREPSLSPLSSQDLHRIVSSRVRREWRIVSKFVWAAVVYQIVLYSFLTHVLITRWGDERILLLCLSGVALYIPITSAWIRRVRALCRPVSSMVGSQVSDILHNVENEYARLADFYKFKKRVDWIGVPVSCAIIVVVTFTLFVKGGVEGNPLGSVVVFLLWLGMSLIAILAENKKRFLSPLRHLELVLSDLQKS